MKICIFTHTFPKFPNDTTAAFLHPLVNGFQKLGHDVTVITPYHPDLRSETFPYKVIPYRYIWPDALHVLGYSQTLRRGTHLPVAAYLLVPFLVIFGVVRLMRFLKHESIDLISVHWILPGGIISAIATRFFHIPFTVTLAGSDVFVAQKNKIFSAICRYVIKKSAVICADSPQYLRELASLGTPLGTPCVIPYPVESSAIRFDKKGASHLRRALGFSSKVKILVSVGRLVEKKGFSYAIAAMPEIIKQYPNIVYIIVGEGDLQPELEQQIRDLGLLKHVKLMGSVSRDAIPSYYSLGDIVLVPSIRDKEGNLDDRPVVLTEAMACERAVIASRFPGNALTITSGLHGILVPEKDSRSLSRAVIELLKNSRRRQAMGKRARQRIVAKFDSSAIVKTYIKLFSTILYEKRHG